MLSKSALKRARFARANARLERPVVAPMGERAAKFRPACGTLDCAPYVPNHSNRPCEQDRARHIARVRGTLLVLA